MLLRILFFILEFELYCTSLYCTHQLLTYRPSSARTVTASGRLTQSSRPSPGILSYCPTAIAWRRVDFPGTNTDAYIYALCVRDFFIFGFEDATPPNEERRKRKNESTTLGLTMVSTTTNQGYAFWDHESRQHNGVLVSFDDSEFQRGGGRLPRNVLCQGSHVDLDPFYGHPATGRGLEGHRRRACHWSIARPAFSGQDRSIRHKGNGVERGY